MSAEKETPHHAVAATPSGPVKPVGTTETSSALSERAGRGRLDESLNTWAGCADGGSCTRLRVGGAILACGAASGVLQQAQRTTVRAASQLAIRDWTNLEFPARTRQAGIAVGSRVARVAAALRNAGRSSGAARIQLQDHQTSSSSTDPSGGCHKMEQARTGQLVAVVPV